jgi:hypothetical protein
VKFSSNFNGRRDMMDSPPSEGTVGRRDGFDGRPSERICFSLRS